MRLLFLVLCCAVPQAAPAQPASHLGVFLEVLPPALRVTVTSARVEFGQQHANAGRVVLDPATGEISIKAAGRHQAGQVQVRGAAGAPYALAVTPVSFLKGYRGRISFGLQMAASPDCSADAFVVVEHPLGAAGHVGKSGCSAWRFGGAIALDGAQPGHYEGLLHVRIAGL